jgi:hypothetical protein
MLFDVARVMRREIRWYRGNFYSGQVKFHDSQITDGFDYGSLDVQSVAVERPDLARGETGLLLPHACGHGMHFDYI